MSEIKLLNCPFCGGEVEMHTEEVDAIRTVYGFHCDNCDMSTYYDYCDREEAIKHWNNRKPVDDVLERLENNSYLCGPTYDIDGYSNDDEREVILLEMAFEIVKEELGGE